VSSGVTANSFPGSITPMLVGIVSSVPLVSPSKLVSPKIAPPLPPEFTNGALETLMVDLSIISVILVPSGKDLPELMYIPIAKSSLLLTVTVVDPTM